MTEWQPIETAPKDGAVVILGNREGHMVFAFWNDWTAQWDDGDLISNLIGYTHWMPSPHPPKDTTHEPQ